MRMREMFQRIGRIVALAVAAFIVYAVAHVLVALSPGVLFSDHYTHKNFTVHMRETVPPQIEVVLDRVEALLATSELDDQGLHHEIYIFNSPRLVRFLMLRDVHFGANLPNGTTYITDANVEENLARPWPRLGPNDRRLRTLSKSVAHEIAHRLLRRKVGWQRHRKMPVWLKEGYCEYVAQGAAIDEEVGLAILLQPGHVSQPGYPLFQNRLMVEYLINVRGLSIDELIAEPPAPRQVQDEVIVGLQQDQAGFLRRLRARQ